MKKIALMTGGNSGEYEISLLSAQNIFNRLDKSKYEPYMILLKGNNWTYTDETGHSTEVDRNDFSLTLNGKKILFDAVFIAIHGNPGENGRLQSYFDMVGIPYTGCDMLSSALTFNKFYCNIVVKALGVPVSPSLHFFKGDKIDFPKVGEVCGYPCFVKSCNSGSSVGVTKVHGENELAAAIDEAFKYDDQILIEKMIHGREIACGVVRLQGEIKPLAITEIVTKTEFYDYTCKYSDGLHDLITPADFPADVTERINQYAVKVFRELGCGGIVRVDFIVTADETPYFLEVNTIPGQTSMSIVPSQVETLGLNLTEVYSQLIEEALAK
ncbi:MAG: D-alanine--D-alanine ligase [Bacteroidales bacterium]|nr:D-alanine--D-alanine ligase [Bacteroidales bacterium]